MGYAEAREAYQRGDLRAAVRLAAEAAQGEAEPGRQVSALVLEGIARRELGDVAEAIERLSLAESRLHEVDDLRPVLVGVIAYNLALSWWQHQEPGQAEKRLRQAVGAFHAEELHDYERQALQNLAWVLADLGREGEAEGVASFASSFCTTQDHQFRQVITEARVALARRDPSAGVELENAVQQMREGAGTVELLSMASALLAEVAVLRCEPAEAHRLALVAVSLAMEQRDSRVLRIATDAQRHVQAFMQTGQGRL